MPTRWTLYQGGRIYTSHPVMATRAESMLVAEDRIVMLGPAPIVKRAAPPSVKVVSLDGATVFPGFCDAHLHLRSFGEALRTLRFGPESTLETMAAQLRLRARSQPAGSWILGRGWPGSLIHTAPGKGWAELEAAAPAHPVLLFTHDHHTAWINEATRKATGQAPESRTLEGDPPGIVREHASWAVRERVPDGGTGDRRASILAAQKALLALGITAVHNFEGLEDFPIYQSLLRRGELDLQVLLNLADGEQEAAMRLGLQTGFGDERLRIGYVKFYLDGALGSRTALLQAPYDDTGKLGERLIEPERLRSEIARLLPKGLVPAMHAIGDGAVRVAIEALESARPDRRGPFRPRIEHAELFPDDLLQQASRLDVVCSVQPTHLFCDIAPAEKAWGKRCADVLPLARMREYGISLVFGSDAPIEDPDPMASVYAASARMRKDGTPAGGWVPEQKLSRAEAIASQLAGVLATGSRADFVAYPADPMEVSDRELLTLRPSLVVAGGKVVHASPELAPR